MCQASFLFDIFVSVKENMATPTATFDLPMAQKKKRKLLLFLVSSKTENKETAVDVSTESDFEGTKRIHHHFNGAEREKRK